MNVKKHCSAGKALVVVVIALSAALMALLTLRSSVAAQDATPPPALDGDTLLVRSFPAGLPVYVVPADLANGAMGDIYVTSPDYLRGNTPLEIPLDPGDYRVTITNYDHPFEFWEDGETNIMFVLGLDEDGQTMSSVTPAGKSYSVTKDAGKQTIVTSLFWPKDQSLEDFVASIPDQPLFEISYEEFFQTKFQDHRIPPEDWPLLLSMLGRTGKLVWYSPDASDHLFIYFTGPDEIIITPDQPLAPAPTPTLPSEPAAEAPTGDTALQAELVLNAGEPVVALASGPDGALYAVTYDTGTVLKITPDGQSTPLYSGLETCGYSLASITVLPDGNVVVNDCVDDQDVLLQIDPGGNVTALPPLMNEAYEKNLISMTSDAAGRIYVGFWLSEGNLTVNFQPFTYLAGADSLNGQVIVIEPDGASSTLFEGGLPLGLSVSPDGTVYASIWGQSGRFGAEEKSYQVCDLRTSFWITLTDQAQIMRLAVGLASPVTERLLAAADLVGIGDTLFAVGRVGDSECGIYRIEPGYEPGRLVFAQPEIDQDVTSLLVAGTTLYLANVNGDVYRIERPDLGMVEEIAPPVEVATAAAAMPTAAPTQAPTAEQEVAATSVVLEPGTVVEISGTGAAGVTVRDSPSLSGAPVFVAYDAEQFLLTEGPQFADGLEWWFGLDPLGQRMGWIPRDFLAPVDPSAIALWPSPTPTTEVTSTPTATATALPSPTMTPVPAISHRDQIVFVSERDGGQDIYVTAVDGSGTRRLTSDSTADFSPAWSPDSQQIVFSSDRDGNDEIYVMNADGSNVRRLTHNNAVDAEPDWSPDGSRFVFWSDRDGNVDIYVMDADGANVQRLTNHANTDNLPAWSPDGTQIAFVSARDGNSEIYLMNADGSNVRRLTNDGAEDINPAWSPDGLHLAFDTNRDGNYEIYVMDASGGNVRRLTFQDGVDGQPTWSPDGTQISFYSGRDGNLELYVMDANGGNPHRITENSDSDWTPTWSPDGKQIAFVSNRDRKSDLYLVNGDGNGVQRLTDSHTWEANPVWSPDGTRVAFISDRDGNYEIYALSVDDGQLRRLTETRAEEWNPAWSPDGAQIAFHSNRDGNYEIYVMNADGSDVRRLTNNTVDDGQPSWSPDSSQIAFISARDGNLEIYVMDSSGEDVRRLTNDDAGDLYPSWSPDGSRIAFSTARDGGWEIYVMNADGGSVRRLTNNWADDWFPSWSPDSAQICFASSVDGNWEIYAVKADGSNLRRLTFTLNISDTMPAWSRQ